MIKPQYNIVLETYMANVDWLDSAFEAAENPITQAVNNTNRSKINNNNAKDNPTKDASPLSKNSFGTILSKIIDELKNLISKWTITLKNRLKMMMSTNKAYLNDLAQRQKTVKPPASLEVITYAYNIPFLDRVYNGVKKEYTRVMNEILNSMQNIDTIDTFNLLGGKKDNELINDIMQSGFKNNSLKTPSQFFTFVRNQFRGESKSRIYKREQLPAIINLSKDYQGMSTKLGNENSSATRDLNRIKAMKTKMLYKGNNSDKAGICKDLVKVATKVRNFYQSFISYYMELKLEQILSYRIIVKKFYQF